MSSLQTPKAVVSRKKIEVRRAPIFGMRTTPERRYNASSPQDPGMTTYGPDAQTARENMVAHLKSKGFVDPQEKHR